MNYNTLPTPDIIEKTAAAVRERGLEVDIVETKGAALEKIKALIPAGAGVMTASSVTLQQIGFDDYLINGDHTWHNLKGDMLQVKDIQKQFRLRKESTINADVWLGSVHAVTHDGLTVTASATGSQLPTYAFSSSNLILVVGTHKIVPNLDEALRRVREHSLPLEDAHQKEIGRPGSFIGKLLILEREAPYLQRNIHLIFVNEVLGY